jgi:hypothetical protein
VKNEKEKERKKERRRKRETNKSWKQKCEIVGFTMQAI